MNIKDLEARMYFLAGQLEEAKKVYREALEEIKKQERELANKEQNNGNSETLTSPSDSTVSYGEPAAV